MGESYKSLLGLQHLDEQMHEARERVRRFGPEMEEMEAPVAAAEQETEALRQRVTEMRADVRRLERGADDKRAQLRKYEERLDRVRNAREEAAARTEIDLIRRAVEADENDALDLMDQVKRQELKLDELEKKLTKLRAEIAPLREELERGRDEARSQLGLLEDQRKEQVAAMNPQHVRLYERVRGGKTRVTLARLMPDGACGHCFSMIPIQEQRIVQQQEGLHRCEACGVILYSGD
jgi:predicted  nucleic acid-binding Zn-ribbon protein